MDAYVTVPSDNGQVVASTSHYNPGPAVNPMLTYVPGSKVMVLSPLHPNPDASQDATPTKSNEHIATFTSSARVAEEVTFVLDGSHADQAGVCSPEESLAAPDLDVVPVASPGSPAPGSDDGPVETVILCPAQESKVLQMGQHFLVLRLSLPAQLGKKLE